MKAQIKAGNLLPITVTKGVTVNVLPYEQYEYLMTTREVAHGYGTSMYVVRKALLRHSDELAENKHFIKGVDILSTPKAKGVQVQPHQVFWTKRGVVRLGFFIKSERAKLFRNLAEELIIKLDEQCNLFEEVKTNALPKKNNHNRLTPARMVSILADVCKIEDKELRISITNKLIEGGVK